MSATSAFLESTGAFSMRRLLRSIPAYGHTAPSSSMTAGPIDEKECAWGTLACFHVSEILSADQIGHCARDREQQRIRRAPASLESPREI